MSRESGLYGRPGSPATIVATRTIAPADRATSSIQSQPIRHEMNRPIVIAAMGVTQILAWGSSYYLPAVLADPIVRDTGWPLTWVVGGLSLGLLVAALISPRVGKAIERRGGRGVLAFGAVALGVGQLGLSVAP